MRSAQASAAAQAEPEQAREEQPHQDLQDERLPMAANARNKSTAMPSVPEEQPSSKAKEPTKRGKKRKRAQRSTVDVGTPEREADLARQLRAALEDDDEAHSTSAKPRARPAPGASRKAVTQSQSGDHAAEEGGLAADEHAPSANALTGPVDYSRKYITLPPLRGSYLHYSNKRLKYNPFPPDLDIMREKLFKLEEPLLLNSQQIADYWHHVFNLWKKSKTNNHNGHNTVVDTYECRVKRRIDDIPEGRRGKEGKEMRKRHLRRQKLEDVHKCPVRIRLIYHIKHADTDHEDHKPQGTLLSSCKCMPEWLHIRRTDASSKLQHTHELELLDELKRSDAIMYFAKLKAEEGYTYAAVRNWLHKNYGPDAPGGTKQMINMTKQDISNLAYKWRQANREVVLREVIEEPTSEEKESKRCLDLIESSTVDGLRRALTEVCQHLPQAARIALPFLESNQQAAADESDEVSNTILEGWDMPIPAPGFPPNILEHDPHRRPPSPPEPEAPVIDQGRGRRLIPTPKDPSTYVWKDPLVYAPNRAPQATQTAPPANYSIPTVTAPPTYHQHSLPRPSSSANYSLPVVVAAPPQQRIPVPNVASQPSWLRPIETQDGDEGDEAPDREVSGQGNMEDAVQRQLKAELTAPD